MLWSLLLSLGVTALVGYFTFDASAFHARLPALDLWLVGVAVATVAVRIVFGGWRLDYLSGGRMGLRAGIRSQVAWDFFAYITPSTVGGGPFVTAFIARDRKMPLGEATSIILFAILLDQLWFAVSTPLLLLSMPYIEVIPRSAGAVGFWSFVLFFGGFMAWVLLFAYGTLVRPQLLEALVVRLFRLGPLRRHHARAATVMRDLRHRSALLRRQPARFYAWGFALTVLPWLARYVLAVCLIAAVYPAVDALLAFVRTVALNVSAVALPTPGGAGGLEGLYVLLLGPLMPESLVAPTLLAWRLLGYYVFLLLGSFILMQHVGRSVRRRPVPVPALDVSAEPAE